MHNTFFVIKNSPTASYLKLYLHFLKINNKISILLIILLYNIFIYSYIESSITFAKYSCNCLN